MHISTKKKAELAPDQLKRINDLVLAMRGSAQVVRLTKGGLNELSTILDKMVALASEADSRLRMARINNGGSEMTRDALDKTLQELNRVAKHDLPQALRTLSSFVEKRLIPLVESANTVFDDFYEHSKTDV